MILVADASPLIFVARAGLLEALRDVAGRLVVPAAVYAEAVVDPAKPAAGAIARARRARLLEVRPDPMSVIEMPAQLGAGEIAALGLARELQCRALVDDMLARAFAARLGIPIVGSAAALLAMKSRGLLPAVAPVLDDWRSAGYRLSPELHAEILRRAGET